MLDPFHQFCHSTVLPQISTATTPAMTADDTLDTLTNLFMMVLRPSCSIISTCSCLFCRIFFKLAIDREQHPTSSKYVTTNQHCKAPFTIISPIKFLFYLLWLTLYGIEIPDSAYTQDTRTKYCHKASRGLSNHHQPPFKGRIRQQLPSHARK